MWIIVNIAFCDYDDAGEIPEECQPTRIYGEKLRAEFELMRLQRHFPEHDFRLFEDVASCSLASTPDGRVVARVEPYEAKDHA